MSGREEWYDYLRNRFNIPKTAGTKEEPDPGPSPALVRRLLGKRVRVTLSYEESAEDGVHIAEGILIGFGEGGDFEIREDDGFIHYCWPMLHIEEV